MWICCIAGNTNKHNSLHTSPSCFNFKRCVERKSVRTSNQTYKKFGRSRRHSTALFSFAKIRVNNPKAIRTARSSEENQSEFRHRTTRKLFSRQIILPVKKISLSQKLQIVSRFVHLSYDCVWWCACVSVYCVCTRVCERVRVWAVVQSKQ